MTKVAYILTPVEFGGAEKVSITFLRHADRGRYDFRLVLLTRPWEKENVFIRHAGQAGYPMHRIPVALRPRSEGPDFFRLQRCVLYLYRILSARSFDLVHTHGYFADIIAAPLCRLMNIPHVSTCHGFIWNGRRLSAYNRLDKLMLRFCDRIIAVSSQIGSELKASGIRGSKITVIRNAVQCPGQESDFAERRARGRQALSLDRDILAVGYVGRLSMEKGVRHLLRAAGTLKEGDGPFRVVLLGDGPERNSLEGLAASLGLKDEVVFMGFRDEVEQWLPAMDVLVLPSLTEGTPMALLEAMSLGIPVIASAVGGVPKVVENGISGYLVEPGDYLAISEKILAFSRDRSLRKRMGAAAADTIRLKFDVHEWCGRIQGQYEEALRGKGL